MSCWTIVPSNTVACDRGKRWKRVSESLFVSVEEEEEGDNVLGANCTFLYCNVDSFTTVRIPNSDAFYDALKHYTWFNAQNPCNDKYGGVEATTQSIKVPQTLLDLLQLAYLIPIDQQHHNESTLDSALLSFKLELLAERFQPQNKLATLVLTAATAYMYISITQALPTLQEMVDFVLATHAPLGIKLNPQVDLLFGNFVLLFLDLWNSFVAPVLVRLWLCFATCVVCRQFHLNLFWLLTLALALVFDSITLFNLHIIVLHRLISKVCRFQLMLLRTCMLMMRGKKINVLKKRVDAIQIDSALLMLGTVTAFFLLFTLQTTLTYHVILLACACGWFAVKAILLYIVRLQFVGSNSEMDGSTRVVLVDGKWWLIAVRHEYSYPRRIWREILPWWITICASLSDWSKLLQGHELPSVPMI